MRQLSFLILTFFLYTDCFGQRKSNNDNIRSLFIQTEYQFLKYDYLTFGLGFQPKRTLLQAERRHSKYSFVGWTINYSKKLENADWGASIQTILYTSTADGPFGIGLEGNYKSVNNTDHFCFKPLIGLSFPFVSIMYAYNFDFYKIKADRINQHELILGLRLAILRQKK